MTESTDAQLLELANATFLAPLIRIVNFLASEKNAHVTVEELLGAWLGSSAAAAVASPPAPPIAAPVGVPGFVAPAEAKKGKKAPAKAAAPAAAAVGQGAVCQVPGTRAPNKGVPCGGPCVEGSNVCKKHAAKEAKVEKKAPAGFSEPKKEETKAEDVSFDYVPYPVAGQTATVLKIQPHGWLVVQQEDDTVICYGVDENGTARELTQAEQAIVAKDMIVAKTGLAGIGLGAAKKEEAKAAKEEAAPPKEEPVKAAPQKEESAAPKEELAKPEPAKEEPAKEENPKKAAEPAKEESPKPPKEEAPKKSPEPAKPEPAAKKEETKKAPAIVVPAISAMKPAAGVGAIRIPSVPGLPGGIGAKPIAGIAIPGLKK